MKNATQSVSTRPYLIRALFEWCNDNAFTPYIAVKVDQNVQVPKEYVQNGEIVLNISLDATSGLQLGNEFIEFKARFGGTPRQIVVPIGQVIAIYAKENGQGMAFPAPTPASASMDGWTKEFPLTPATGGTHPPLASVASSGSSSSALTLMSNQGSLRGDRNAEIEGKNGDGGDSRDGLSVKTSENPDSPDPNPPTPGSPSGRPKLTRIK